MTIILSSKPLAPRKEHDYYGTPIELCRHVVKTELPWIDFYTRVLDPGMGDGVWGRAVKEVMPECTLHGIDLRETDCEVYNKIVIDDFLKTDLLDKNYYDLVIGNPPFKYAEEFVRLGLDFLREHGILIYLLRLSFLEGQKRGTGLFAEKHLNQVLISSRRIRWAGYDGTDDTAHAVYVFTKSKRVYNPTLSWMNWDYDKKE